MALAGPVEKISSNEGEGAGLLSKIREQQSILLDIRRELIFLLLICFVSFPRPFVLVSQGRILSPMLPLSFYLERKIGKVLTSIFLHSLVV